MSQATSNDKKLAHIDEKDEQAVVEKVATVQKWLEDQNVRQSERPKNVDPILTSAEIGKKRDEVVYFATPILTKPKPKPPVVLLRRARRPLRVGRRRPLRRVLLPLLLRRIRMTAQVLLRWM